MEMSAQPRNDDEPGDARLSQLYRESGAPEPPATIDQAILAAARREAHARPRRIGAWLREWRVPMSIAATFVVSATLVMVVVEEGGHRIEEPPPTASVPARKESPSTEASPKDDAAARTPPAIAPDDARRAKDAASLAAEPGRAATRQAAKTVQEREALPDTAAPGEAPRAQPAPPPPAPSRAAPPGESEQRAVPRQEPDAPRAAEIPSGSEPSTRRERTEDIAPDLGMSRRGFVEDQGADQGGARPPATSTLGPRGFDAPAPVSPPREAGRAAPAAPGEGAPASNAEERRDAASAASTPPPAAKRPSARVQAAPKPRSESRGAVLARGLLDQPPEKWLERVEQLRSEGRHSDADGLMVEFRLRFPDHPAAQPDR